MSAAGTERPRSLRAVLAELDTWYERLEALTGQPVGFRVGTENRDAGYPFIEVDRGGYRYLAYERGRECMRQETTDLDELLYWVIEGEVFDIVVRREQRTRPAGFRGDTRRRWFPERIRLLGALRPEWGRRAECDTAEILARSPYGD